MYLESDRTDARGRQRLVGELHRVLADVRAAVFDWKALQAKMRADADAIDDAEGAALLNWFADGAMTLLGYHVENPDESTAAALGLFGLPGPLTEKWGGVGPRHTREGGRVGNECAS